MAGTSHQSTIGENACQNTHALDSKILSPGHGASCGRAIRGGSNRQGRLGSKLLRERLPNLWGFLVRRPTLNQSVSRRVIIGPNGEAPRVHKAGANVRGEKVSASVDRATCWYRNGIAQGPDASLVQIMGPHD